MESNGPDVHVKYSWIRTPQRIDTSHCKFIDSSKVCEPFILYAYTSSQRDLLISAMLLSVRDLSASVYESSASKGTIGGHARDDWLSFHCQLLTAHLVGFNFWAVFSEVVGPALIVISGGALE